MAGVSGPPSPSACPHSRDNSDILPHRCHKGLSNPGSLYGTALLVVRLLGLYTHRPGCYRQGYTECQIQSLKLNIIR